MFHLFNMQQIDFIREQRIKFALAADQAQEIIKQMYKDAQRYAEKETATTEAINTLNFKIKSLVNYFNEAEKLIQHIEGMFEETAWSSGKTNQERHEIYIDDLITFVRQDIQDAIQAGNTLRAGEGLKTFEELLKLQLMVNYMHNIPAEVIPYIYEYEGIMLAEHTSSIVYVKERENLNNK